MKSHICFAAVVLVLSSRATLAQFTQGPRLQAPDSIGRANQGTQVAVSADGSTAIVGGPSDDGGAGAVWIWIRSGAGWIQQSKLVGSGAVGKAGQGSAVAISGDGNTAVVGGPTDNPVAGKGFIGAVWIWVRSGGVWVQQGPKLVGSGAATNASQGRGVAISADGNTILVGGPDDDLNSNIDVGVGAVWVWTRSAGVWSQQGKKLVGSGYSEWADQGNALALSADGDTAIIGGFYDKSGRGATWVWTRSAGVWTQQGSKLVASDGTFNACQGMSVSLSADGNTAIIGGPLDGYDAYHSFDYSGAAWIWTRSDGVWRQQGGKLAVGGIAGGRQYQGRSVSLSSDGNTAIVGGSGENDGAAWVWTRSDGTWTPQGPKLVGSGGVAAGQGTSVSLTADGNTAFVAGSSDRNSIGAVWTWTRTAGEWRQQGTKLVGSGVQGGSLQGSSVSLSADGSTAIVGGTGDNGFAGAAWVWIRNAGVWSEQAKLVASDALGDAQQGQSVSLSADGNTAIVGGSADHDYTGAAWVWTRSAGVWSEQAKLVSSDAVGKGWQGLSVSLSADGNTAIVGGPGRHVCRVCSSPVDVGDSSSDGAAWIWTRTDGIWTPQAKLFAPDAFPFSRQGLVVALSADGKTAITVSEYGAWFWTKSAGTWIQQSPRVDASGAATLSALGNTAVIGVHVWNRSGASWTSENTVLSGSDAVGAAGQGASVSLSADGNTVVIGGPYDNTIEIPSPHRLASPYRYYIGATWVWRRNQGVWKQLGSKLFGWGVEYPMQGGAVAISLDGSTILIGGTDDDHGAVGSSWIFSALTPSSPKKRAVAQ